MFAHRITEKELAAYRRHLLSEERAAATVEKYLRDIALFAKWSKGQIVTKEMTVEWKNFLQGRGCTAGTVNCKLSALNGFLELHGRPDCKVKLLRVQKRAFRSREKELTLKEYQQLLSTAVLAGNERLALVMETLCAAGIRVSELGYITVEAARERMTEIALKGKIRTILLPKLLCGKLLRYAAARGIESGRIFRTACGMGLSRRQSWGEMKRLCFAAQVDPSKVFPHNLRHLFAVTHYRKYNDIVRLADILGHSGIDTTRLYLATAGAEHAESIEQLGLVRR